VKVSRNRNYVGEDMVVFFCSGAREDMLVLSLRNNKSADEFVLLVDIDLDNAKVSMHMHQSSA
jgi:hypothetical protein